MFVHDALLEHVRSGNTEVELSKAKQYLVKLLQPISEEDLSVLDFINTKNKSVNDLTSDLTNGFEVNGESTSIQSQGKESLSVLSDVKTIEGIPNGDGSEVSLKTDELSERSKSVSAKEMNGDGGSQEEKVSAEDSEGVYDLAPRSNDTYTKKMQAFANMSVQEKEELKR